MISHTSNDLNLIYSWIEPCIAYTVHCSPLTVHSAQVFVRFFRKFFPFFLFFWWNLRFGKARQRFFSFAYFINCDLCVVHQMSILNVPVFAGLCQNCELKINNFFIVQFSCYGFECNETWNIHGTKIIKRNLLCVFAIVCFTFGFVLLVNFQIVYYAYAYEIFPVCGYFNNISNIWLWFGYVLRCFNIQKHCFVSTYNFGWVWFIQSDTKISRISSGVYHENCERHSDQFPIPKEQKAETFVLLPFVSSDLISSFWSSIDDDCLSMFSFFFILFLQTSNQRRLFIFVSCTSISVPFSNLLCFITHAGYRFVCMYFLLFYKKKNNINLGTVSTRLRLGFKMSKKHFISVSRYYKKKCT